MRVLYFCDSILNIDKFRKSLDSKNQNYFLISSKNIIKSTFLSFGWILFHRRFSTLILIIYKLIKKEIFFIKKKHLEEDCSHISQLLKPEVGIHSMGIIYSDLLIQSCKYGILNCHIGKLPEMRGRSVFEWSLLLNVEVGNSIFFIDCGIDTGKRLLFFEPFEYKKYNCLSQAKKAFFDSSPEMYKKALNFIDMGKSYLNNDISKGRRYYVMSKLMLNVSKKYFSTLNQ